MGTIEAYKPSRQVLALLGEESRDGLQLFSLRLHGIGIRLMASKDNIDWLQKRLPRGWQGCDGVDLTLVWRDARCGLPPEDPFFAFEDPELWQEKAGCTQVAWQRDFVGRIVSHERVEMVTGEAHDDGFFNAMRWLLPPLLVRRSQYLMHSAAVVVDGSALLFVGPSGSGKTTTANKAGCGVMGDDIAILSLEREMPHVEAAFLGQGGRPDIESGHVFPLQAIFRLGKGEFSRERCGVAAAMRHVLGSLHQPVWADLTKYETCELLANVQRLVEHIPVFALRCRKEDTWERLIHGL